MARPVSFRVMYSQYPKQIRHQSSRSGSGGGKTLVLPDKLPTNQIIDKFLDGNRNGEELKIDGPTTTAPPIEHKESEDGPASRGTGVAPPVRGSPQKRASKCGATSNGGEAGTRVDTEAGVRDDTETVLNIKERRAGFDPTGQRVYESACRQYRTPPCSALHRKLASHSRLDLRNYGAGPRGARALSLPMLVNTTITSLNLQGNSVGGAGIGAIADMMLENEFIIELNLSQNNLRSKGAKVVARILADNHTLQTIDLSDNHFTDNDIKVLAKPLEENPRLKHVNLSSNEFGEEAGLALGRVIRENGVLQLLDLSWNQLRARGAMAIARGLKENMGLNELLLGWNGFGDAGAVELAAALRVCTITHLDLSANRVGGDGFNALCKALGDNEDLTILRIGKNPILEDAAVLSLEDLHKLEHLRLEELDMSDVTCGRKVIALLTEIKARHPGLVVKHGYTDSYGKRRLKTYDAVAEGMRMMNQYCDQHGITMVDLFSRFDADGSMSVSYDEFKQGLKETRIPLTELQVEKLINMLDEDGDGEIDFSEMILGAERYRTKAS